MQLSDLQVGTKLKKGLEDHVVYAVIAELVAIKASWTDVRWYPFQLLVESGFTLASPVRWKPVLKELTYRITEQGEIEKHIWTNHPYNIKCLEFGNVFPCYEKAQARRDQIYKLNQE